MNPHSTPSRMLLPFDLTTVRIPAFLRAEKRWAPWIGVWSDKRQKWDKIPVDAKNIQRRLSTANPKRWFSYDDAMAALRTNPGKLSGIGFVMTGMKGLVGIDMDRCVGRDSGRIEVWAQTIVDTVDSYTELSPSGTGLRVFTKGEIDADFTNHRVGVEVYQGDHPRFLTVTGARLEGMPVEVQAAAGVSLRWMQDSYREKPPTEKGEVGERPLLIAPHELPSLDALDLPYFAREFFSEGTLPEGQTDKSHTLAGATIRLFKAGLTEAQVQSFLVSNHYAMEVALGHRQQRAEKAEEYLWKHHTVAAREHLAKHGGLLTLEDFDLSLPDDDYVDEQVRLEAQLAVGATHVAVGIEGGSDVEFEAVTDEEIAALPEAPPKKAKHKFKVMQAGDFANQSIAVEWLIENYLPKAELATLFGASGSGKTFFALDMLVHIAMGAMWCGKRVPKSRRVLIIAAEGASGLRARIRAVCRRKGVRPEDIPLFVIDGAPNMLEKDDVKALVQSVKACGDFDLVVMDTLSQVTPGANENSSEDMGRALAHIKLVGKALKAMVMIVGHTGKDASRGQRGWSGIRGALDAEIEVVRGVTFRSATLTKIKDGEGEGGELVFELVQVNMDVMIEEDPLVGPELKTITTCVVEFQLDPVTLAIMQEAERDAQAKQRGKNKEENKEAQERNGVTGVQLTLRTVLLALQVENPGKVTFSGTQVQKAFNAAYVAEGHKDSANGISKAFSRARTPCGWFAEGGRDTKDWVFTYTHTPPEPPTPLVAE